MGEVRINIQKGRILKINVETMKDGIEVQIHSTIGYYGYSLPLDCSVVDKAESWKFIQILSLGLSPRLVLVNSGHEEESIIIFRAIGEPGTKIKDIF